MVDISVEILACSVPVPRENLCFKIKTWWTQVESEEGKNLIQLPSLPMIENYYNMSNKETIIFVEMWYANDKLFPSGSMRFLGMTKSQADYLLKNPQQSPSVEWLEVHDPIENIIRGKLLLKIHAKFITAAPAPVKEMTPGKEYKLTKLGSLISPGISSSYFSKKQSSKGSSSRKSRSVESSPFPVQVQTDAESSIDCPTISGLPYKNGFQETLSNTVKDSSVPNKVTKSFNNDKEKDKRNKHEEVQSLSSLENQGKRNSIQINCMDFKVNSTSITAPPKTLERSCPPLPLHNNITNNDNVYRNAKGRIPSTRRGDKIHDPKYLDSIGVNNRMEEKTEALDEMEDVIHLLNNNFEELEFMENPFDCKKRNENCTDQIIKQSQKTLNALPIQSNLLKFRHSNTSRFSSDDPETDSASSLNKIMKNRLPDQNETDSSDFSPYAPSKRSNIGPVKITGQNTIHVQSSQHNRKIETLADSTLFTMHKSKPTQGSTNPGYPPRSRRIAAAIYGD